MLISIDLETVCNVPDCAGFGTVKKCPHDHALHFKKNKVTVIAAYWELPDGTPKHKIFRDIKEFETFIKELPSTAIFTGQNFKFDLKTLSSKVSSEVFKILVDGWQEDSQVMAVALSEKISADWLREYEEKRKELNSKLKKAVHREAGEYSLKTLAPYFCGVNPFWETDDHDNDDYVIKDAKYTYILTKNLLKRLEIDGTLNFYRNKLFKWNKNLLHIELKGICLDFDKLNAKEDSIRKRSEELLIELKEIWKDGIDAYKLKIKEELITEHKLKLDTAIAKTKETKAYQNLKTNAQKEEKIHSVITKQLAILDSKLNSIEDFNLESPSQMLWLLQDYYKYDCKGSVGKDTKQRLIIEGKEDIKLLDEYGKCIKLLTGFFPTWREMQVNGVLYCNFNIGGTRTGRLSSSSPNLQQVPRSLRNVFRPREGYTFIVRDMSSVEPNLIGFFSEDPVLCGLLIRGENFHNYATKALIDYVTCDQTEVKKKYPKERDMAKQADLSLFYGTGVNGLKITAQKHRFHWTEQEARQKLNKYKATFKRVFQFKEELDSILISNSVTNILGRKYRIEDPTNIYMQGFNSLIQSSASDLVVNSGDLINNTFKSEGIDGQVLLLVHDEIVAEVRIDQAEKADKIMNECMTYYKLPTIHGDIKLQTEGGISNEWSH